MTYQCLSYSKLNTRYCSFQLFFLIHPWAFPNTEHLPLPNDCWHSAQASDSTSPWVCAERSRLDHLHFQSQPPTSAIFSCQESIKYISVHVRVLQCLFQVYRSLNFLKNAFIYLFMVALDLPCCMWAFSSCDKKGLLSSCRAQASHYSDFSLQSTDSKVDRPQ